MKFAFYVSNKATRLKRFLQQYADSFLISSIEFILIDNTNNIELENLCNILSIKNYKVDLAKQKQKNKYISDVFLSKLKAHDVSYAFVFADRILVDDILDVYKNKLINFHPSLLPSHKGLYAIDQALTANTFLLGNSAHIITKDVDEGMVIMQNIFPAHNFIGYDEILDKQIIMLFQLMTWAYEKRIVLEKKDKIYIKDAHYTVAEFIPNIEI